MTEPTSRRRFLVATAGALGLSPLLAACGGTPTRAAQCEGYGNLSTADLQQRQALNYVDQTPEAGQLCSNCQFYQPGQGEEGCGGCQLFAGPVVANGWCQSWVAIAS